MEPKVESEQSVAAGVFQAGGALRGGSAYVERQADRDLLEALRSGQYAFILAPRQMGKSSLMMKTIGLLESEGVRCANVDITAVGVRDTSVEQWYLTLADSVVGALARDDDERDELEDRLVDFWESRSGLNAMNRWLRFLREMLLATIEQPIVIFIDEIDSVQSLPFDTDDFFAGLRACFNARSGDPEYERLTFVLLGVAAPSDLMQDTRRTPFNIGVGIELNDFTPEEALQLPPYLESFTANPKEMLQAILHWTDGHAYMTQRLLVRLSHEDDPLLEEIDARVGEMVHKLFLDENVTDANLQTALDRIRFAGPIQPKLLALYRRVLTGAEVQLQAADPVHTALRLAGMLSVYRKHGTRYLKVRNRIYAETFDLEWLEDLEGHRVITESLQAWLESGRSKRLLLRGAALSQAIEWRRTSHAELSNEELSFLADSELGLMQSARRRSLYLVAAVTTAAAVLVFLLWSVTSLNTRLENALSFAKNETGRANAAAELADSEAQRANDEAQRASEEAERANAAAVEAEEAARREREANVKLVRARNAAVELAEQARNLENEARIANVKLQATQARVLAREPGSGDEALGTILAAVRSVDELEGAGLLIGDEDAGLNDEIRSMLDEIVRDIRGPTLEGHEGPVLTVAFSSDGSRLATGGADGGVRLWDSATGRRVGDYEAHRSRLSAIAFGPRGERVLATSYDGALLAWRIDGDGAGDVLHRRTGVIKGLDIATDSGHVVAGWEDGTIRVWTMADDGLTDVAELRLSARLTALAVARDGESILVGDVAGSTHLLSVPTGERSEFIGHVGAVLSVAYSPDGRRALTAGSDQSVRVIELPGGGLVGTLNGHSDRVRDVSFGHDASLVVSAGDDARLLLWDASKGIPELQFTQAQGITALSISSDGRLLAAADESGRTSVRHLTLDAGTDSVRAACTWLSGDAVNWRAVAAYCSDRFPSLEGL